MYDIETTISDLRTQLTEKYHQYVQDYISTMEQRDLLNAILPEGVEPLILPNFYSAPEGYINNTIPDA
jgi:hypothetical protein